MKNLVITFHDVQDAHWFENVLKWIGAFYEWGDLDTLYQRLTTSSEAAPTRMAYITFDDGNMSFFNIVYPIIKKLEVPVCLFVCPKNIKTGGAFWFQRVQQCKPNEIETYKALTISEIYQQIQIWDPGNNTNLNYNINKETFTELLSSDLVTFGAHTQNHPILSNESDIVSYQEITNSIHELASLTCKKIDFFAYPNGRPTDFSQREINTLQEQGIKLAFTTTPGFATSKDFYRIKRVGLTKGNMSHVLLKTLFPKIFSYLKRITTAFNTSIQWANEDTNRSII